MRILIYKRTHRGDPDAGGCFGAHGCMGKVRGYGFDAVMGVGGIGGDAQECGIVGKVNWIGIGPQTLAVPDPRGPGVTFHHFLDYDTEGPDFRAVAPTLAKRMYDHNVRVLLHDFSEEELREAKRIVARASRSRPSARRLWPGPATVWSCRRSPTRPDRCRGPAGCDQPATTAAAKEKCDEGNGHDDQVAGGPTGREGKRRNALRADS